MEPKVPKVPKVKVVTPKLDPPDVLELIELTRLAKGDQEKEHKARLDKTVRRALQDIDKELRRRAKSGQSLAVIHCGALHIQQSVFVNIAHQIVADLQGRGLDAKACEDDNSDYTGVSQISVEWSEAPAGYRKRKGKNEIRRRLQRRRR